MKLLTEIANKYGTDKGTSVYPSHGFSEIYHDYFNVDKEKVTKVLEIGIDKGNSLRMWRDYFPNAVIYGIDVQQHQFFREDRIVTDFANQSIKADIDKIIDKYGSDFDLIIDDGGHDPIFQQITLGYLFPHVKTGGFYVVEDLHTSFMEDWLKPINLSVNDFTAYNVLKQFIDEKKLTTNYLKTEEIDYINNNYEYVKIYDVLNDKKHITSILKKK